MNFEFRHHYSEVNRKDFTGTTPRKKMPKCLYKPDKNVIQSLNFKPICKPATWSSFTAQSAQSNASDLALARSCKSESKFADPKETVVYNHFEPRPRLRKRQLAVRKQPS